MPEFFPLSRPMGVADLIMKCCLECLCMNFVDLNPAKVISMSKDADRDWSKHPPHVVVDGNCWLYECSYYLARGLALGNTYEAGFTSFKDRFMKRVDYVKQRGFKITVVFDGRRLRAKRSTDAKRREAREKNAKKAAELEQAGQGDTSAAHDAYNKSFVVTNKLIHAMFEELKNKGVAVFIAPHEGDAQCAWFAHHYYAR